VTLDEIRGVLPAAKGMTPGRAQKLYDFIVGSRPRHILHVSPSELAAAYMAAALDQVGAGEITGIYPERAAAGPDATLWSDTRLARWITPIRSRAGTEWELMKLIEQHTVDGQCTPVFDLCFVQASRTWNTAALAFFLLEKLLVPGGWIVFDDITWTFGASPSLKDTDSTRRMEADQRTTAQVGKVFSLLVRQHPSFAGFKDDGLWGWARKKGEAAPCYCPVCETTVARFARYAFFGRKGRANAQCPNCGSLERHRLVWLYFERKTNLFDPPRKKMLHIAPEAAFADRLANHPAIDYLSGDLESPWHQAMVKMDITNITMPDNAFDVIYCSDVLEHVPDDRQAIQELYRVLKPGGWAVLNVPIIRERTFEDSAITSREDRMRHYLHPLHVRAYGKDYAERLAEGGFRVTVDPFFDSFAADDQRRFGLRKLDIFYCDKG
jgi:predicted O-methyltransferase YrrM